MESGPIFLFGQGIGYERPAAAGDAVASAAFDSPAPPRWNGAMAPAVEGNFGSPRSGIDPLELIEGVDRCAPKEAETLATGMAGLDAALEGGLSTGSVTEFVSASPSSGGQTALLHLLEQARLRRRFAALVDGSDRFDPETASPELLDHLLWVRCRSPREAMQAADALLRDRNLETVLLDLRGCPERELGRLRSAEWYRLQRLASRAGGVFCVFTPLPLVPSAQTRVVFEGSLPLSLSDASARRIGAEAGARVQRLGKQRQREFPNLIRRTAV